MKLFIKTMTGKTISLDIFESTTIADIKTSLVTEKGYNFNTTSLVANGKTLIDTDEVIVNQDGTAYIYSAQSQSRLNLLDNSIGIYLVNRSSSLHLTPDISDTVPIATTFNNSTSLWQRNKLSLIIASASAVGAAAIVIAVLFPPTYITISSTFALALLMIAGSLTVIAGILLFKICLNERHLHSTENTTLPPLPRGWQLADGICQRYLMLDHGGVLDGELYNGDIDALDANDLVLNEVCPGLHMVLKNGVTILQQLSDLTINHHFKLAFHSKNHEDDQQRVWQQIKDAAALKNAPLPLLFAMVVYDASLYPGNDPKSPSITINDEKVMIIGYGQGEGDGKSCVRQALSSACTIDSTVRKHCFVFDDGVSVISTARGEGYQAYLIGDGPNAHTLATAINDLYSKICVPVKDKKNVIQQPGEFSVFASSMSGTSSNQTNMLQISSTGLVK